MGLQLLFSDKLGNDMPVFLVSAYHPDSKKPQEEFDDFMASCSEVLDVAEEDIMVIVWLDVNVQLGQNMMMEADDNQSFNSRVTGPFGHHHSPNGRGDTTAHVLAAHSSTLYRKVIIDGGIAAHQYHSDHLALQVKRPHIDRSKLQEKCIKKAV
eukprot:7370064-Ditylum_brightwellii.AAC.1